MFDCDDLVKHVDVCFRRFGKRFDGDDAGWHVEVCSGRFRKGFMWTIRKSMQRLAPDDFEVFHWTMRGFTWRFFVDDSVKVVF